MRRPACRSWPRLWRSSIRQIAANAGLDGSVILEKVRTSGKNGYGFDAYKEEYCDMIASRHRGSRQGDPLRSGECRQRLRHGADHRVSGGRQAPAPRTRCSRSPKWAAWAVCIKSRRKALKLLDFLSVQKRIYAKLMPKIQAHDRVTEIGTCLKSRCRFFLICASLPFPCGSCGRAFPRWLMGLFRYLDSLSISISETNCSLESLS